MGVTISNQTFVSSVPDENGYSYWVDFEKRPFSAGACRHAFRGTMHGNGPKDGHRCVVKVPKKRYAKHFDAWIPDIASSKKSSLFAEKFNSDCLPRLVQYNTGYLKIEFVVPLIAKVDETAHFKLMGIIPIRSDRRYVRQQAYVAIEPFLEGKYEKFNSNGGYENEIMGLLLAFTHWTWSISGHKFMICDLQGIKTTDRYLLTDPAIHSLDQIYGPTDLGVPGMEKDLSKHRCNAFCKVLGLTNPMKGMTAVAHSYNERSTKYSFQLTEEEKLRAVQKRSEYFSPIAPIYE